MVNYLPNHSGQDNRNRPGVFTKAGLTVTWRLRRNSAAQRTTCSFAVSRKYSWRWHRTETLVDTE